MVKGKKSLDRRSKAYKDAMQRTIPDDNERRRFLNKERNPRPSHVESPVTRIMAYAPGNEPTQTLNPITGMRYEDFGRDGDVSENGIFRYHSSEHTSDSKFDFINYQLALARKEVRDGKMEPSDYRDYVSKVSDLIAYCNDVGLPVELIGNNTPEGLQKAVESVGNLENRRVRRALSKLREAEEKERKDIYHLNGKINLSNIPNKIDYFPKFPLKKMNEFREMDDFPKKEMEDFYPHYKTN